MVILDLGIEMLRNIEVSIITLIRDFTVEFYYY